MNVCIYRFKFSFFANKPKLYSWSTGDEQTSFKNKIEKGFNENKNFIEYITTIQ